jgi:hypothetical protein
LASERCSAPNTNVRTFPNNRLSAMFSPPPLPHALNDKCHRHFVQPVPFSHRTNYPCLQITISTIITPNCPPKFATGFFIGIVKNGFLSSPNPPPPPHPTAFLCQNCNHCPQELMQKYCVLIAVLPIESISVFCLYDGSRVLAEE